MPAWLGDSPSWSTFRLALKSARSFLAFRKSSGQHATCDECRWHKSRLKGILSAFQRSQVMEGYVSHLLQVWRDRQDDASWVALSVETSLGGPPWRHNSTLTLRCDGLDQAKHRCPRVLEPQKAMEKLKRPTCPVFMSWAHGHCFTFSVQDQDVPKGTATTLEDISRLLSIIYNRFNALPASLHIVLDNTSASNKNQIMIKYWVKVLLLGCCRHVHIRFPLKGHTHNCIDALGGAAVTACNTKEFSTPEALVTVYKEFLEKVKFESSVWHRTAYKCEFGMLTGPRAPHLFHLLFRSELTQDDLAAEHKDTEPGLPAPHPNDIMLAVHDRMHDLRPYQLLTLLPGSHLPFWRSRIQRSLFAPFFSWVAICVLFFVFKVVPLLFHCIS